MLLFKAPESGGMTKTVQWDIKAETSKFCTCAMTVLTFIFLDKIACILFSLSHLGYLASIIFKLLLFLFFSHFFIPEAKDQIILNLITYKMEFHLEL